MKVEFVTSNPRTGKKWNKAGDGVEYTSISPKKDKVFGGGKTT